MEFNKAYNRKEFIRFLQNRFLPEDFTVKEEDIDLPVSMKYTTQVTKLGSCPISSLDLVVYEIKHTSSHDARVALSKEAFRLLANEAEDQIGRAHV